VGQSAIWLGKVLFLGTAVVTPILMKVAFTWRGFDLGSAQWLVMGSSVILVACLLCAFVGGLTALASTPRQVIALAIIAVVATGVWVVVQPWIHGDEILTPESVQRDYCGSLVGGGIAIVGLMSGWFLATVPRRRITAGIVIAATLLVSNVIAMTWERDWTVRSELKYAKASNLELKMGPFDPEEERPGRRIWPTLRIAGLGRDEVATVLEFAPIKEGEDWPPEGSHTEIPTTERGYSSWLHYEHARALFKHYPKSTLWQDYVGNDAMGNGRPSLDAILKGMKLKREEAIAESWRLQIVVHEMVQIETMPYRQLWSQENQLMLRPGVRLEMERFSRQRDAWEMPGRLHRLSSAVLPIRPYATLYPRGRFLDDDFFLILVDREMRENRVYESDLYQRRLYGRRWTNPLQQWIAREGQYFEYRLWNPREQGIFLDREVDQWIDEQEAHFWYAAERGIVEFELSPSEMKEILPEPAPK
ncbi:MAG: hypothetical protein AAGH89_19800, partial [Verrucomicrobiota bacterium]